MSARARLDAALEAARLWHAALPEARAFCDWPGDITWAGRPALDGPARDQIRAAPGEPSPASAPLLQALQAIAGDVEWRHTYTADEVGQHFLDHFGWFELAGPEGHFHSDEARVTVGYWGADLFYPRHCHAPAELYTVVSGSGLFALDDAPDLTLRAGDTRLHPPNRSHALTTTESPILTLVFWRGEGLADPPRLSTGPE